MPWHGSSYLTAFIYWHRHFTAKEGQSPLHNKGALLCLLERFLIHSRVAVANPLQLHGHSCTCYIFSCPFFFFFLWNLVFIATVAVSSKCSVVSFISEASRNALRHMFNTAVPFCLKGSACEWKVCNKLCPMSLLLIQVPHTTAPTYNQCLGHQLQNMAIKNNFIDVCMGLLLWYAWVNKPKL